MSSASTIRRHRGFQPDEVRKIKSRFGNVSSDQSVPTTPTFGLSQDPKANGKTQCSLPYKAEIRDQTPPNTPSVAGGLRTGLRVQTEFPDTSGKPNGSKYHPEQEKYSPPHARKPKQKNASDVTYSGAVALLNPSKFEVHAGHEHGTSPSGSPSVEVITDKRKGSCWSRVPIDVPNPPKTEWDSAIADIDSPAWLRASHTQTLPPYKIPEIPGSRKNSKGISHDEAGKLTPTEAFKRLEARLPKPSVVPEKRQLTYKEALQPKSSIVPEQRQITYKEVLQKDQPTATTPSIEKPNGPSLPSNGAVTVPPHLRPVSQKSTKSTDGDRPSKETLPPHLRKKNESSNTPAPPDGNSAADIITAMQKYVPPHMRSGSDHDLAPTIQTEIVSAPSPDQGRAAQTNINIDEELAAAQHIMDTRNDAQIAALVAEGEQFTNDEGFTDEQYAAEVQAAFDKGFNEDFPQPTSGKTQVQSNTVPPHLRPKSAKAASKEAMKEPKSLHGLETKFLNGHQDAYTEGVPKVTNSSQNGKLIEGIDSQPALSKRSNKSWDPTKHESGLVGWDGGFIPPPVEWDYRPQHDPKGTQKAEVIKHWAKDQAEFTLTNTSGSTPSQHLQNGTIPMPRQPTTIPNPDEFTQYKRELTAVDHIETYKAKQSASPQSTKSEKKSKNSMTKDQRREQRRMMRELESKQPLPENPHKCSANIYLRPAEMQDMRQVTLLHNYWAENTPFAYQLKAQDEVYWRERFQEAYDEKDPFLVAVHMGSKTVKDVSEIRRKKSENIVGFAFAADYGLNTTAYRYTVELEIWVHYEHLRQGIGKTLLDRMIACMDPGYSILERAPLLANNGPTKWSGGGHCVKKTLLCNLHYNEATRAEMEAKKKWLLDNDFQELCTLPIIGWKWGKAYVALVVWW